MAQQEERMRSGAGENQRPYQRRRRSPRYQVNDRQSFVDILGTVLRYVLIIVLIMVIIRFSRDAYNMGYEVFSNEAMAEKGQGQEVTVTITDGMSDQKVGELLQSDGLIKDARVFPLQVRLSSGGTIVPGTYTLSTEMTVDDILNELTKESDSASAVTSQEAVSSEASSDSTTATGSDTTADDTAQGSSSATDSNDVLIEG